MNLKILNILKNQNRIYQDDTIIAKAIEETLLDLYPLNEQNDYYVQDSIKEETDFIVLKNQVLENINYKNNLIKNIVEENSKFIIPLTSNKRKYFEEIVIENNENENKINLEKNNISENKKKENYKKFLINISENEKSYNLGNIMYDEYQKKLTQLLNPDIILKIQILVQYFY